mmetsp:Transcript_130055/g.324182  ORF Transcript_130055/g.324182 Transcript_130055/m.324182 type:complete len:244 (-) Transcript_130055:36-767(-)
MPRYWDDSAYAQFYASSDAERGLVNNKPAELSRAQLERFQGSFAEWSEGRERGVRATDFRQFLMQVGIDLTAAQARALWQDFAPEGAKFLPYAEALSAYQQVIAAPVQFRNAPGAAPPGKAPPRGEGMLDLDEAVMRGEERRRPGLPPCGDGEAFLAAGTGGLSLPADEARELLLAEGLPALEADMLLARLAAAGSVPQAALFDFLERWTDALDDGEPGPSKLSERKAALAAPVPLPRAPVLA